MAVHVGDRGRALSPLHPQGFVEINGQRYDARSEFGVIDLDCAIIVVNGDHLGLIVRTVESVQTPGRLRNHGQRVYSSFGERLDAEAQQEAARRRQWRAARRRYGILVGTTLGALAAGVGLWCLWDFIADRSASPWVVAAAVAAGGILWGVGVFRFVDNIMQRLGENYYRATFVSEFLALTGTTGGAVVGIPLLGLSGGFAVALLGTVLLGAIVPGFIMLAEARGSGPA
jgi:hypothetical protein